MMYVREATARFTIRFRCDAPGGAAFIVDDRDGTAYLFRRGLQARLTGANASHRLASRLAHARTWTPVPAVAPYTLAQLHQLAGAPAAARCHPTAGR